jgi:hypothetical protein
MGDFSYSNNGMNTDRSFYYQMNAFLRKIVQEAKLDCYDLRDEQTGDSSDNSYRDVLLVRDGKALLSVYLRVKGSADAGQSFMWPPAVVKKEAIGLGARLSQAIEEANPTAPTPVRRALKSLRWWIVFRGADKVETTYLGSQFDLDEINKAFNAIETRLIAEVTRTAPATKA